VKCKICKYKNDIGEEWYQIKIKWLIFWYNYEAPTYVNYDTCFWGLVGDRFKTKESAQEKVNLLIQDDKRSKIQLMFCEEI
jgi:hypothetical protein